MTANERGGNIIVIFLIVLLMASIILGFYFYNSKDVGEKIQCPPQTECPIPEAKAILDVDMYTWGINEYNPNELLFDYWINNFGEVEAKNIKVNCKLINAEKTHFSAIDNYGNLASERTAFGEFTPKKTLGLDMKKEYSGFCYVESCDNCEILYKRIPELVESYEG